MASLNKEKLEQLLEVRLLDAHDNWKCRCPFHDEKTPSFFIHKQDYICHCFGCGIAGYIDSLIAKKRGISHKEAREILGVSRLDIGWKTSDNSHFSRGQPTIFPESWLAPWPKKIHPYILERGFKVDTLKMAETRFDPATRRQVFPIRDEAGNLVGATGRSVADQDPKWFHYWNYQKGEHLYHPAKSSSEALCITEGPLDALWLTQNGWHACAILGSRASDKQISDIKCKAHHVILALDNDDAGRKATEQLYHKLKGNCQVEYAVLPWFANDVCDLSPGQLEEVLTNTKNAVQVALSVQGNTEIH